MEPWSSPGREAQEFIWNLKTISPPHSSFALEPVDYHHVDHGALDSSPTMSHEPAGTLIAFRYPTFHAHGAFYQPVDQHP